MCNLLEYMTGGTLLAMFAVAILGLVVYQRFLAFLSTHHPTVHHQLGSPTVVVAEGEESDVVTSLYILKGEYRQLKDPQLSRLGNLLRAMSTLVFVMFGLFLALAFTSPPTQAFLGIECFKPW